MKKWIVYEILYVKMCELCQLISLKVLNQKEFYCSFEKLSRSATKICNKKMRVFILKNLCDINLILVTSPKVNWQDQ